MAHKGHWQHARREATPADRQHARREVCAFGLRGVLAWASPQGFLHRSSCQQCSFHGIASSQSIADPYTQVRKEYERSTITPTLPPTLHFTFHRLECIVPPIRRPRERTELPFECPHTCPGAVSMFGLSKILPLRIPALVVVTKCLPVCLSSAAYIRKHQASVRIVPPG